MSKPPDFEIQPKGVKPEAAIQFWKSRTPLTMKELEKLDAGARGRAFTVAGLAKQDQVALVHSALRECLEKGGTLADFKKSISSLIEERGWKSHRIDTIFRNNMQSAYSAGRYTQMQAVKDLRPYWQYLSIMDNRVTPTCAALNGEVYPADHEFWDSNYPPNHHKCRAGVRTLSEREVGKEKLTVQTEMPKDRMYTDPKTGMEYPVAMPGATDGFASNPGKDWLSGLVPSQVDFELASGSTKGALLCSSPKNFSSFEQGAGCFISMADIPEKHIIKVTNRDLLPGNLTQMAYINAFLEEFGVKYGESKAFKLPGVSQPLVINEKLFLDKKTGQFKVLKDGREKYLKLLAQTIKNPFEIWMHPSALPGGKRVNTLSLLRLFMLEEEGRRIGGLGIFRLYSGRSWSGSTVFTPSARAGEKQIFKYLDELRLKILLEHGNAALAYREK